MFSVLTIASLTLKGVWRERGGNELHLIVSQTHRPPKFNSQSRFEREGQAGGSAAVLTLVAAFSQPNTRGRGVDVGCGVGGGRGTYCKLLHSDKCIPYGERIACVGVFLFVFCFCFFNY